MMVNIFDFKHCLNVGCSLSPIKNASSDCVERSPLVVLTDYRPDYRNELSEVNVWFRLAATISSL